MLTRVEVLSAWRCFLGREPTEEYQIREHMTLAGPAVLIDILAGCEEFKARQAMGQLTLLDAMTRFDREQAARTRSSYFAPTALRRSPDNIKRVLLVGWCSFRILEEVIEASDASVDAEFILFNHAAPIAEQRSRSVSDYDFALVHIPLRLIFPIHALMDLPFSDSEGAARLLNQAISALRFHIATVMKACRGMPTFVLNYFEPQANLFGRFTGDTSHEPSLFIRALNDALKTIIAENSGSYLLDADRLSASFGRRFVQDDPFWLSAIASTVGDWDYPRDALRLEPEGPLSERYDFDVFAFNDAIWAEAVAMHRTLRGIDQVKMVCVDLDDTLWRGILADQDEIDELAVEGWPLGFIEALITLKKRGIILAIISKNDEARIMEIWPQVLGNVVSMDAFSVRKINWRSKAENVRDAIREVNVLPDSVVFIDDNPVERATVSEAIPGIRVLGHPHLDWRRILLWSAETQVPLITAESARRGDMIRSQIVREEDRSTMSRESFLQGLSVRMTFDVIRDAGNPHFNRALELINKTNQFNTTGKRWTREEADSFLATGGRWWTFTVQDKYTNYGLVGVIVQQGTMLSQMVMSCRVFGLDVELAAIAQVVELNARENLAPLVATIIETDKNGPSRQVYQNAGWSFDGDVWTSNEAPVRPGHVEMNLAYVPV